MDSKLVLSIGSGSARVGFACLFENSRFFTQLLPVVPLPASSSPWTFPTLVGRPRVIAEQDETVAYVGDEALAKRGILNMSRPIECGRVVRWDDMEQVWSHGLRFDQRVGSPSDHAVLLTETPLNPSEDRGKTASFFFETFDVPHLFLVAEPVAALAGAGRSSGVVLDSGYDVTHSSAISEMKLLENTLNQVKMGGNLITERLVGLLGEGGIDMTTRAEKDIVSDIKVKLGYVSLRFEEEAIEADARGSGDATYELLDGTEMNIGNSLRFRPPEILFQPSLSTEIEELRGVAPIVADTIQKADPDLRGILSSAVVLSGGSTSFENFPERLTNELNILMPEATIKVIAPVARKLLAWRGGAMVAELETYRESWISKAEYEDVGPSIVDQKRV